MSCRGFFCANRPQSEGKKGENLEKYPNIPSVLRKQWNMKVTGISIVVWALGKITEKLQNRLNKIKIRGRLETTQKQYY